MISVTSRYAVVAKRSVTMTVLGVMLLKCIISLTHFQSIMILDTFVDTVLIFCPFMNYMLKFNYTDYLSLSSKYRVGRGLTFCPPCMMQYNLNYYCWLSAANIKDSRRQYCILRSGNIVVVHYAQSAIDTFSLPRNVLQSTSI